MIDRVWAVYALADPRDGEIRYVGVTRQSPRLRWCAHVNDARNGCGSAKYDWIRELLANRLEPMMVILQRVSCCVFGAARAERKWIGELRSAGAHLHNGAAGVPRMVMRRGEAINVSKPCSQCARRSAA